VTKNKNKKKKNKTTRRTTTTRRYSDSKKNKGKSLFDLSDLTKDSPYTDAPDNGVNLIETKPGTQ
jgi:hypothetical protein